MGAHALPSKQVWKIDPSIDVDRVSLEDVKLIFSQAEKRLDDTVRTGESIAFGRCYLLALLIYTIRNVLPNKYFVPGSEPERLMAPSFFAATVPKEKITLFIYMSEIENYNQRIEKNLEMNERRWKRYRRSVILFLVFPMLLGVLYALLEWLG